MVSSGTVRGAVDTLDTLDTLATPLTARGACHELKGPVRSYRSTSRGCFSFARRCRPAAALPSHAGSALQRHLETHRVSLPAAGISPHTSRTAREQTVACLGAQSV